MPFNRRSFLRRSGLLAIGAVAAPAIVRSAEDVAFKPGDKPRRIIHLVADGMSMATLTCADHLSHLERQRGLSWIDLYRRPEAATGLMDVRSLNSLVTDSSASSSAWGSGSRIVNGAVNLLPDGRDLTTLYQLFGDAGWKRGLVTTTEITHATPSGFAINMKSRNSGDKIAEQHLERGLDVLLGGGTKYFSAKRRKDQRDLQGDFAKKGYAVMTDKAALAAAPSDKSWLGTFSDSHLPFTIDQINIERLKEKVPTLPEMTRAALGRLEREDRFILQVEGGRVDQAAHLNDAPAAFRDLVVFDEALDACLDFQKRHPDTLLVVTTDHATGNPGLNGAGGGYSLSVPLFHNLAKVRGSQELMLRRVQSLGEIGDEDFDYLEGNEKKPELVEPDRIGDIIFEISGYRPSKVRTERLRRFLAGKGDALYDLTNSGTFQLAQMMANYVGVGWTSLNHTSDYVPIVAVGPGAERFRGFVQNVDVFRHYTQLAGIDFKNPELPLMAETGPSAEQAERLRGRA
jgi:alkaline phosphatase